MSATSTPQFYTTAFPTTTPTYSPTQNATLPIIVVDGQATNMTTTNALIGATLALIIVAVALAAGRYLPAGWAQRLRRMVPDKFKSDPLGSVTAMVNDPKSILKDIQIPDSVRNLSDMVPQSIKDKIVPKELQDIVGVGPSATVPRIDTPETSPPPPASSRKIEIAPPIRRAITPEPIQEDRAPSPPPPEPEPEPEPEKKEVVSVDAGVVVLAKDETKIHTPTTIEIKPEDLDAVKAFMESRNVPHVILP
jgi:hypothetical protein